MPFFPAFESSAVFRSGCAIEFEIAHLIAPVIACLDNGGLRDCIAIHRILNGVLRLLALPLAKEGVSGYALTSKFNLTVRWTATTRALVLVTEKRSEHHPVCQHRALLQPG